MRLAAEMGPGGGQGGGQSGGERGPDEALAGAAAASVGQGRPSFMIEFSDQVREIPNWRLTLGGNPPTLMGVTIAKTNLS